MQKLLTDPEVRGLILFGSGTSLAVKQIIERSNIPTIAIAMTDKIVEDKKNIFRYYIPVAAQSQMIISEIKRRGYQRVVTVTTQQEAMLSFENILRTSSTSLPAGYIEVSPGETDLKAVATKIISMQPDGICLLLLPPRVAHFRTTNSTVRIQGRFVWPSTTQQS